MLDDRLLRSVKDIIFSVIPKDSYKVYIFGSRAIGNARKFSDIDIGIEGAKLSIETYFKLKDAFEESNIPYTVDIIEMNETSDSFKKIAQQKVINLN